MCAWPRHGATVPRVRVASGVLRVPSPSRPQPASSSASPRSPPRSPPSPRSDRPLSDSICTDRIRLMRVCTTHACVFLSRCVFPSHCVYISGITQSESRREYHSDIPTLPSSSIMPATTSAAPLPRLCVQLRYHKADAQATLQKGSSFAHRRGHGGAFGAEQVGRFCSRSSQAQLLSSCPAKSLRRFMR